MEVANLLLQRNALPDAAGKVRQACEEEEARELTPSLFTVEYVCIGATSLLTGQDERHL